MQFTLRDVLIKQYGVEAADHVFYAAGETAGRHFYENLIQGAIPSATLLPNSRRC